MESRKTNAVSHKEKTKACCEIEEYFNKMVTIADFICPCRQFPKVRWGIELPKSYLTTVIDLISTSALMNEVCYHLFLHFNIVLKRFKNPYAFHIKFVYSVTTFRWIKIMNSFEVNPHSHPLETRLCLVSYDLLFVWSFSVRMGASDIVPNRCYGNQRVRCPRTLASPLPKPSVRCHMRRSSRRGVAYHAGSRYLQSRTVATIRSLFCYQARCISCRGRAAVSIHTSRAQRDDRRFHLSLWPVS